MSIISRIAKLFLLLWTSCFFVKQSLAQVRLQTGAPEINIPLYTYSDSKNSLSASVSLMYIGGNGIKVNDVATSVGTGWALSVGGVITRIQNGEPDDQKFVDLNTTFSLPDRTDVPVYDAVPFNVYINQYYPNGYLYTNVSPQTSVTDKVAYHPMFPDNIVPYRYKPNSEDREQDVFVFHFGGRTGKFMIGKDKSILLIEDSKLKIEFNELDMTNQKIRTRISKFKITDENGIEYIFDEKEINENLISEYNIEIDAYSAGVMTTFVENQPTKVISKWFLSEIKNPLTNKKIVFNYTSHEVDFFGEKIATEQKPPGGTAQYTQTVQRTKAVVKKINFIVTPDNQKVQFNYSGTERVDHKDDYPLENISIYQNELFKYRYNLEYGYFFKKEIKPVTYSFLQQEKRYARLCLKSIARVDKYGLNLSPHVFEYHFINPYYDEGDQYYQRGVPARFTYSADFLGYSNEAFYMEDENGTWQNAKMNFLGSGFAMLGMIKRIYYPEGGFLEYHYSNNIAENAPFTGTQRLAGGVKVEKTILYDGISHDNDIIKEYRYVLENGKSSFWGFESAISAHTKDIRVWKGAGQRPGKLSTESYILYKADFGKAIGQLGITYISTGGLDPYSIIIMFFVSILIEFFAEDYKDYTYQVWSNVNMIQRNPLPFQYERVEVLEKDNGSVVYEFTSPSFYPLLAPTYGFPFSARPRAAYWLYGLPKVTSWKDQEGNLIRKVENTYLPVVNTNNNPNHLSVKWEVTRSIYEKWSNMPTTAGSDFVTSESYYPVSGHVKLLETKETTFNPGGADVVETTQYTYTDDLQVRTVEKLNSLGGSEGVTYYYPQDYAFPNEYAYITNMREANMYAFPIVTASWLKEDAISGPRKTTKTAVTKYTTLSNGAIKPEHVFIKEEVYPKTGSYADSPPVLNPLVTSSLRGFLGISFYVYDNEGNLVQQTLHNKSSSRIFDYNGSLPVAEVTNAGFDQIAYTSFEADGKGNWTFSGSPVEHADAITGKKVYNLSSGSIVKVVDNAKTYIVSYWRPSNLTALAISGTETGFPVVSSEANGWKYYEHKITGVSNIVLAGSGLIDEVRLYPFAAAMISYTYDPLMGATSQSDANGRLQFNEYDNFGRLVLVRDHDKKIVRKICYNYPGQPESCIDYYSVDKSKPYIKNDCAFGYRGTSVYVDVPENQFVSTLSQAHANQLAEEYGQQQANVLGACLANCTISSGDSRIKILVNSIVNNATFAYFYIVFSIDVDLYGGQSIRVGVISSGCKPSVDKTVTTVTTTAGNRTWNITIYASGEMWWQLAPGSPMLPANTTLGTETINYNYE